MKQQINLYQAEFQQPEIVLSADHMFMGAGGLLLFMLLFSIGLAVSNSFSSTSLATLKAEVTALTQANEQMNTQLQTRAVDQNLAAKANYASRQLQVRQDMLQMVERTEQRRDTIYFSELLAGLARQHVDGLWLSRIDISASGRDMYLEGTTLDAKRVPQLVGNLGREQAYVGREFRKVVIKRNKDNATLLDFVLTTGDPESESLLAFLGKKKEGAAR